MRRRAEIGLWVLLVTGMMALPAAWFAPIRADVSVGDAAPPRAQVATARRAPRDSLVRAVTGADPFRLDRRPARVAYNPAASDDEASVALPPKPVLVLRGVLLGDTARALVEGLPGVEGGRLVKTGDVVGSLRVTAITAGLVRVTGMDTSWALTMRRAP